MGLLFSSTHSVIMHTLIHSIKICFITFVFLRCCKTQSSDGFNMYKDLQIGKNNDMFKKEDVSETSNKEELILPSLAAKFNVDDTSKRDSFLYKHMKMSRDIPEPRIFEDEIIAEPLHTLMVIPGSKMLVPRFVKNVGMKSFNKRSGINDENKKTYQYYKRVPGSVLTWTLTSATPVSKLISMRSDLGKQFPSSFVATMG